LSLSKIQRYGASYKIATGSPPGVEVHWWTPFSRSRIPGSVAKRTGIDASTYPSTVPRPLILIGSAELARMTLGRKPTRELTHQIEDTWNWMQKRNSR
jgi:hypothetical protein